MTGTALGAEVLRGFDSRTVHAITPTYTREHTMSTNTAKTPQFVINGIIDADHMATDRGRFDIDPRTLVTIEVRPDGTTEARQPIDFWAMI